MKKRVLTGIKPTGEQLHLGNYFGAMAPMIAFANKGEYDIYMFVANLHALTEFHDAGAIRKNTVTAVKTYLACGLNPEHVHIYNQSDISAHAELMWVFACVTNIWFMKRMHAYKAALDLWKEDDLSMGTFNYPVLMAADILLYDPTYVPVGKDQKQHVEYARDIAQKFNHLFGETFLLPEPYIQESVATVPGLDGRKMSKSYNNYIGLFDDAETVRKKVARIPTSAIPVADPKDPETCNIFAIYKLFLMNEEQETLRARYLAWGVSYKDLKTELSEQIIAFTQPIIDRYAQIDDQSVIDLLVKWAEYVRPIAQQKIQDVYQKVGFNLQSSIKK
jgi:tryptophanyl-tRNA synthetase